MNRILRISPMLEAAQPSDYKRIEAEEYFRMKREKIPWKVAAKFFATTPVMALESGTKIVRARSNTDYGVFTDWTDIQERGRSEEQDVISVIFTRGGYSGDFFVWSAECTIMLHEDDWWSIYIEQSFKTRYQSQSAGPMIEGVSIFLCDDLRGLDTALRDTVIKSSEKFGQVESVVKELRDMFG
jgi:hypothetical protein